MLTLRGVENEVHANKNPEISNSRIYNPDLALIK